MHCMHFNNLASQGLRCALLIFTLGIVRRMFEVTGVTDKSMCFERVKNKPMCFGRVTDKQMGFVRVTDKPM